MDSLFEKFEAFDAAPHSEATYPIRGEEMIATITAIEAVVASAAAPQLI